MSKKPTYPTKRYRYDCKCGKDPLGQRTLFPWASQGQDLVNRTLSESKQAGLSENRLRWLRAASDALDAARMDLPFDAVKVFAS